MKNTRKPVDYLVSKAKSENLSLPLIKLQVTKDGLSFTGIEEPRSVINPQSFTVDIISYGVQDLVYTRVFSIIVVMDENLQGGIPFVCHSFVCDSRDQARKLTYGLAAAFQDYGRRLKLQGVNERPFKKFAIDLRTADEQTNGSDNETDV